MDAPQQLIKSARPRRFKDLIGQQKVVKELRHYFDEHNDLPQAMLFQGPSGVGKTSCARICAVSLTCEHQEFGAPCKECQMAFENPQVDSDAGFDITEINCAALGLDKLKDVLSHHVYAPAHGAPYRIYILDELQSISSEKAQKFLLKILEEAPSSTKFVLCTMEPENIISAIVDRCMTYQFRSLESAETVQLVTKLLKFKKSDLDPVLLSDLLDEHKIASCRAITQATQKYLAGAQPDDAVKVGTGAVDTLRICRSVRNGAWPECRTELGDLESDQARLVRKAVANYMTTILREDDNDDTLRLASKAVARLTQINRVDDSLIVSAVYAGLYDVCMIFS